MGAKQKAMRPETVGCRIDVLDRGGTYIARAAGLDITASCTCGRGAAAERCADKVWGKGNWSMIRSGISTFVGTRNAGVAKPAGAWRDPAVEMPDDDVAVLIRRNDPGCPISRACHDGNGWWPAEDVDAAQDVTGWMQLHEAARILDAGGGAVMADQDRCVSMGVEFVAAVAVYGDCGGCEARALSVEACLRAGPCCPAHGRTDGRKIIWKRADGAAARAAAAEARSDAFMEAWERRVAREAAAEGGAK